MGRLLLAGVAALGAFAADADFNGRWNIKVDNEARKRVWWLEVNGAGTPGIHGRFVGFPGGDTNKIEKIWIDNGALRFSFHREQRNKQGKQTSIHQEYRATLAGGKLAGTMEAGAQKLSWTGVRAPRIDETDDGTWKPGKPVKLFNGKDLAGWRGLVPGQPLGWDVKTGILASPGKANNLESERKFWNFDLHAEFRLVDHSNSGIGLRARYEVQILDDFGRPPDTHGNGALYSRILPAKNASRKAGEWQTMDIRLIGRQVSVTLNGQKVIDKAMIDGFTAMATDADEDQPGPITLQGDHEAVEFRALTVTPLERARK